MGGVYQFSGIFRIIAAACVEQQLALKEDIQAVWAMVLARIRNQDPNSEAPLNRPSEELEAPIAFICQGDNHWEPERVCPTDSRYHPDRPPGLR